MSKQTTEKTKVWNNVDYTNTEAYRTIQAWKQAATEAGLALEFPDDFPNSPASQLQRLRELDAMSKGEVKKTVTKMARLLYHSTENGKVVAKECLTVGGQFYITDFRKIPYSIEYDEGKYYKPNVVGNSNQKFNPDTGEPIGNSKLLAGQKLVYDLELPKDKAARKKFIDQIIESTGSDKDSIIYYYTQLNNTNMREKRDNSYSYEDFVNCSIEEMKDMNNRGGGSKGTGYWRDKDNKLRDKDGNLLSPT
ncbi:MAG: hypothetical protein QN778_04170 [Nitrososphaeraceae archaeon]|nr:hypothetical protein [Nitrososphaeraceae archaeon]MDW0291093.1 hypothetical protein [Nitrososphaeraceae archaeon]